MYSLKVRYNQISMMRMTDENAFRPMLQFRPKKYLMKLCVWTSKIFKRTSAVHNRMTSG